MQWLKYDIKFLPLYGPDKRQNHILLKLNSFCSKTTIQFTYIGILQKCFIKMQEPKNSSLVQQYPSMPPTLFRYIGLKPYLSTYLFELLYKTSYNTSQTFFSEDTVSKTKTFQKSQLTLFKKTEMSRKIRPHLEEDNVTYREKKLGENFCTQERLSKNCSFHQVAKNVHICQIKWSDDLSCLLTLQRLLHLYLLPFNFHNTQYKNISN